MDQQEPTQDKVNKVVQSLVSQIADQSMRIANLDADIRILEENLKEAGEVILQCATDLGITPPAGGSLLDVAGIVRSALVQRLPQKNDSE